MSEPKVSSLAKALRVLDCFSVEEPELGGTEIAEKLGIGKAILANLPPEEWLSRIPETVPAHTPQTITDTAQILQELRATRERGFSIDNCEHEANVRCVGVPVYNARGRLVAGISSSGPAPVMTDRKLQECADILLDITQRIRERLYS